MDKSYFKEYYHLERKNWWFTVRRKILSDRIKHLLQTPQNIYSLNVGAATGTTSDMLTGFGRVMSVEYDEDCCQFTQTFLTSPIIQGTITDLPFEEGSFDLVCAFDVIEHVADDTKAIAEIYRVCKSGGYMAITVPAYAFLWGPHDVINRHFRRYTMRPLLGLLAQHKGTVVYKTYYNTILFLPITAFRLVAALISSFKRKKVPSAVSDHEVFGTEGVLNSLLAGLFTIDYYLLKWGIRFPAGVSIMVFFKKQ
ncbi:MAG: methyltransferase domain-containing protein [Sediminibacterium sp.]|nr:methyltransferase domain-containing protein [Sediminibacterium sp.]